MGRKYEFQHISFDVQVANDARDSQGQTPSVHVSSPGYADFHGHGQKVYEDDREVHTVKEMKSQDDTIVVKRRVFELMSLVLDAVGWFCREPGPDSIRYLRECYERYENE